MSPRLPVRPPSLARLRRLVRARRALFLCACLFAALTAGCDQSSQAESGARLSAPLTAARKTDTALATEYSSWAAKYRKAAAAHRAVSTRLKTAETILSSSTGLGATPQQLKSLDKSVKLHDSAASLGDTLAAQADAAATLHTQLATTGSAQ